MSHQHAGLMRLAAVAPTMTSVRSQKLSDHAKLWESFEVLRQVDKFENYIMNAELGVESAMSKKLSLQAMMQDSYHSEPAPGRLKNDLKLIAGVT